MANSKKIYFYKVNIKSKQKDSKPLSSKEINTLFGKLDGYNQNQHSFVYELAQDDDKTVVEFIDVKSNSILGRIGKQEDLKYLQFRSSKNHTSHDIDVPADSYAEKFTYFYYIFDTGILLFLSIQGAPNFRKFDKFLNEICNNVYDVSVIAVSNKNVIEYLKGKDIIPGFSLKVTVPADEFLGCENLGLPRKTFTELENAESITIEIGVKSKKRKNLSKNLGKENSVFEICDNSHQVNPNLRAKIKARNNGKKTQTYDVFEEMFTYSIDLPTIKESTLFNESIKNAMTEAYNNSINAIQYMI